MQFRRRDKQVLHGGQLSRPRGRQAVQLAEQVLALPPQDAVEYHRVTGLHGRHQLEEELVPVAPGSRGGLGQPVLQFGSPGRGEPVHNAVRLDWLRLALGIDQAVPGEPLQDLVQVPDVEPAPLLPHRRLEAGLQLIAMGRLGVKQC